MARVLLLVPARTYRATDFLVAAGRLGLDVVVGSDGALPLDRHLVVRVDPGDLEASVDRLLARSGPVDAVVAVDTPMLVLAAAVAARMDRTHNRVEAVRAAGRQGHPATPVGGRWRGPAGILDPARRRLDRALKKAAAEVGFPCGQGGVAVRQPRGAASPLAAGPWTLTWGRYCDGRPRWTMILTSLARK